MENKKTYESPKMSVLLIERQAPLMESSYHGGAAYLDNAKDPIA
jgi:hypothetical protein